MLASWWCWFASTNWGWRLRFLDSLHGCGGGFLSGCFLLVWGRLLMWVTGSAGGGSKGVWNLGVVVSILLLSMLGKVFGGSGYRVSSFYPSLWPYLIIMWWGLRSWIMLNSLMTLRDSLCSCFLLVRVLLIRRRRPALRGLPNLHEVFVGTFVGLASNKHSYYDDFRWNFVILRGRSWSFLLC